MNFFLIFEISAGDSPVSITHDQSTVIPISPGQNIEKMKMLRPYPYCGFHSLYSFYGSQTRSY